MNDDYFDINKNTFILVPGWLEPPDNKDIKIICQSFLYRQDYNVMTLNWHASSLKDFLTSAAESQIVHIHLQVQSDDNMTICRLGKPWHILL